MAINRSDSSILLDQHKETLVRDIFSVDHILDRMIGKQILTEEEKNKILGGKGEDKPSQNERLLDFVKRKGIDAFVCFREALRGSHLEDLLRYCPTHNAPLMFWCEQCECLLCEKCKNEHVFPQHVFTAIFSVNEDIKTKFDCFIRESRSMLNSLSRKQISERREHIKMWAERYGEELQTLVSRIIDEEIGWVLAKLRNKGMPSVDAEESGRLEGCRQSCEATVGQHSVQPRHENDGDLRTLLRRNREAFVSDMQSIGPITDLLYQEKILTYEEKCKILQKHLTPQDQARRLLDIISCKGTVEAICHFTKALETTYTDLAELLHQCPEHNKKLELYCEDCKVLICEDCQKSKHPGHLTMSTTTITTIKFERFILDNRENIMDIRSQKICPEEVEKRVKERGGDLRNMVTRKIDEEVAMFVSNLDMATCDTKEDASCSRVVKRETVRERVLPLFIMEREILTREESRARPIKEDEMYNCLIQCVHPDYLKSVQRVRAVWRIYLHNNASRAKLLKEGITIRKKSVECKETNPSLKSRMANKSNTRITIKDIPESVDDSVIVQFLSEMGCKTVGPVVRKKIRYNHRLTNCSNGDRVVYVEQKPKKAFKRNVKIGSHRARVFYSRQGDRDVNGVNAGKKRQTSDSSPKTQVDMEHIDEAFNEYVGKQKSQHETRENITEHRQGDGKESVGNEQSSSLPKTNS
ncbi:uncharacterized protein LOC144904571 isoform X2 [Branchiostoma floridae x Branchiostoma belcheri]